MGPRLLCIGTGNMGTAILKSLLASEPPLFERVMVMDSSPEKYEPLVDLGAEGVSSFDEVASWENLFVLLAVKPQQMDEVLAELKPKLAPNSVLVSIAAGVSMERLQSQSGHAAVVRVMPNTPAMIGMGASGWIAGPEVSEEQKRTVRRMLESFGVAVEVNDEDRIDSITALSGSGPAYVFYFLEALMEGAQKLGLPLEQAKALAIQTVIGAGHLAEQSPDSLEQLRAKVTSKGGTTERAIAVFEERNLKSLIADALRAGYQRAKEL